MTKSLDFTIRQAARRLDLTMNYLYQLVWSGKLQAYRRNGKWTIPSEALEARLKTKHKREQKPGKDNE